MFLDTNDETHLCPFRRAIKRLNASKAYLLSILVNGYNTTVQVVPILHVIALWADWVVRNAFERTP